MSSNKEVVAKGLSPSGSSGRDMGFRPPLDKLLSKMSEGAFFSQLVLVLNHWRFPDMGWGTQGVGGVDPVQGPRVFW